MDLDRVFLAVALVVACNELIIVEVTVLDYVDAVLAVVELNNAAVGVSHCIIVAHT